MFAEQGALNSPQKVFVWGNTVLHWERKGTACWKTNVGRAHQHLIRREFSTARVNWEPSEEQRELNTALHKHHVLLWLERIRCCYWDCLQKAPSAASAQSTHDWTAKLFVIATSVVVPDALTSKIICNSMESDLWSSRFDDSSSKWAKQTHGEQVI